MKNALFLIGMAVLALFTGCDGILKQTAFPQPELEPTPIPEPLDVIRLETVELMNNTKWTYECVGTGGSITYADDDATLSCAITMEKHYSDEIAYYPVNAGPFTRTSQKNPITHPVGIAHAFSDGKSLEGAYVRIKCNGQTKDVYLSTFTGANPEYSCAVYYAPVSVFATTGPIVSSSGYMRVTATLKASAN